MKEISIRDLHQRTGVWVRRAADEGRIVVKDRGRPVATLVPYADDETGGVPFAKRKLVPGFAALPRIEGDCTEDISRDRDGR